MYLAVLWVRRAIKMPLFISALPLFGGIHVLFLNEAYMEGFPRKNENRPNHTQ
jgi:hypothetical protein